jgi:hypothetical protein
MVDLASLGHQLGQVLEPGADVEVPGLVDHQSAAAPQTLAFRRWTADVSSTLKGAR